MHILYTYIFKTCYRLKVSSKRGVRKFQSSENIPGKIFIFSKRSTYLNILIQEFVFFKIQSHYCRVTFYIFPMDPSLVLNKYSWNRTELKHLSICRVYCHGVNDVAAVGAV